ncbi:hypothetical protein EKG37_03375 [Robertmurraya yapensis]|uniref:Uncharacterized protein n=1 Tax=Bacillus yapensis TaxID=2492960 RepID=A0A3S0IME3_9BACI|nr:hypothetical protein [Bacillus yapensis]RTR35687.1 hypothetical protein EKG37_03375 [Bacillus yapensis]TKS98489.1 hypothetical protein FAR12_03375 [Bacillus yapensis]
MEKELRELVDAFKKLGFPSELNDYIEKLVESRATSEPTDLLGKLRQFDLSKELTEFVGNMVKQRVQKEMKEMLDNVLKLDPPEELRVLLNRVMEVLSTFNWQSFYERLRNFGFLTELKLNEQIQNSLNRKEVIEFLNQFSFVYAEMLENLNKLVEMISGPLNLPTKNDVANIAKLAIQHEEKLNAIEEQLNSLDQFIRERLSAEVGPVTLKPATSTDVQSVTLKPTLSKEAQTDTVNLAPAPSDLDANARRRKRKLLLFQSILQPSNDLLDRNNPLSLIDLLGPKER